MHIALLIAVTVALSSPLISGSLVYDDHALIAENPLVTKPGVRFQQIFWEPFPNKGSSFRYQRPVTTSIYRLLHQDTSSRDTVLHIANILLHAFIGACSCFLINLYVNHQPSSFLATLFFAVMPGQAEAVLWISSLSELLVAGALFPNTYF